MGIVITIFNIISIIILVLMLLKGYFSGLWKSLVSLGILVLGITIVVLLVNPVGNSIANPENAGILQEAINEALAGEDIAADPQVAELILGIVATIVKMLVLFVGLFIVVCIIEPIASLIVNSIVFRKKNEPTPSSDAEVSQTDETPQENEVSQAHVKNKKPIWFNLGGLGVKLVQFFVVMIALFIPLFAVNSLVLTYEDTIVENNVVEGEASEVFGTLNKLDKAFVKAPVNVINGIFKTNIEINILSSLSVIEIGNHKINLIKEVCNVEPLVDIVLKNTGEDATATDLIIEGKDELAQFIKESILLETIYPIIINILEENEALPDDFGVSYDDLKSIDFGKDKESIANIIIILAEYLEKGKVDLDDPSTLLSDEELPDFLKNIGNELANTTFMEVMMKLAQSILDEVGTENEEFGKIVEVIDLSKINNDTISSDLYNIGLLLNKVDALGILDNEDLDVLKNLDSFEEMITIALKLSILEGSEETFIIYIFDNYDFLGGYDINVHDFDFDQVVSWDAEVYALFNIIEKYLDESGDLNFDVNELKNLAGLIKGPNGETCYFANYIIGSIVKAELEKVIDSEIYDKIEDNYDLTDPEVFEEVTESIGAAIEVGTSIEKIEDVENLTKEDITEICNTIATLDNYKSEIIYDLVVDLTTEKGIDLDITEEVFMETSLAKEAEVLEEVLTAITNNVSDEELDKLIEQAEEETVIIKAFIEQYIK